MKLLLVIKKISVITIAFLLFMVIAGFVYVYTYGYFNADEQAIILKDYSNIQDNFYLDSNTEVNAEAIKQMDDCISSLSPNIAKVFSKDWAFIVTNKIPPKVLKASNKEIYYNPDSLNENIVISGVSNWHTRTVFIQSEPNIKKLNTIFIHELGHCFDYEFGSLSSTDEFKNIYSLHKDTYVEQIRYSPEKYASSSESEFFATLFKEYFISPDYLKLQAPEAYDFIDTIYKEVSGNVSADTTLKYDLQSVIIKFKNEFKKLQSDM